MNRQALITNIPESGWGRASLSPTRTNPSLLMFAFRGYSQTPSYTGVSKQHLDVVTALLAYTQHPKQILVRLLSRVCSHVDEQLVAGIKWPLVPSTSLPPTHKLFTTGLFLNVHFLPVLVCSVHVW